MGKSRMRRERAMADGGGEKMEVEGSLHIAVGELVKGIFVFLGYRSAIFLIQPRLTKRRKKTDY